MKSEVKRAEGVYCPKCMALALVIEDKVFCQFCKTKDGDFKQIIPGENGK